MRKVYINGHNLTSISFLSKVFHFCERFAFNTKKKELWLPGSKYQGDVLFLLFSLAVLISVKREDEL